LLSQLLETLRRLVSGEIVQLRGRHRLDLSEATYEGILNDKTASLFRFATAAGAALAGANQVQQTLLADFGEQLGMAFQLVDDVLDYTSQATGKTLLADLSEGKVTLPLVLAANREPRLLEWVRGVRAGQSELVAVVRDHVVGSGACEQVRLRAKQATERAARLLHSLPESPARRLLQDVARQIVVRDA
jgi:octaprenyl-diphosphate synthase